MSAVNRGEALAEARAHFNASVSDPAAKWAQASALWKRTFCDRAEQPHGAVRGAHRLLATADIGKRQGVHANHDGIAGACVERARGENEGTS